MDAVKKQYQLINGEKVEYPYGSIPGLYWTDANGNNYRAFAANLLFYNSAEEYIVVVDVEVQPNGTTFWLKKESFNMIADDKKWRVLQTGALATYEEAHDQDGNLNPGYVTNGNFFSIVLGYNPTGAPVSVFEWIYIEIADYYQLNIVA